MMRKAVSFLTSIKLAAGLIAYLAITGMLATLIPQGQAADFYRTRYPGLLADAILVSGFSGFFGSPLFLVPSILFLVNLSACTIRRLALELRTETGRRFGPVILHAGMMVLALGSILSYATRKDGLVYLSVGERVELPETRSLTLLDYSFELYADGRPKEWISTVKVSKGNTVEIESYALRVNHPLKVGSMTLYQSYYGTERILSIQDADGLSHALHQGEILDKGKESALFMAFDVQSGKAVIRVDAPEGGKTVRAGPGDKAGNFEITGIANRETSGIQAVEDHGYPAVLAGLLLTGLGAFMTFYRKLGDSKA